jgi:hypothetical protein
MITGKAKELFLKWFKEEKLMIGFEDKPIYTKIFLLCEWFKIKNYCISVKSNYIGCDYSARITFNEGNIDTLFHKDLETAYVRAIEISNEEFNDRLE